MEMKDLQHRLFGNNSFKENLDFCICYLSKVWNPWPRKCFTVYSREPVEFCTCRFFFFLLMPIFYLSCGWRVNWAAIERDKIMTEKTETGV